MGNVVLHVAAIGQSKVCFGFEKAEWPAKYAELMGKEFIFWMNFFGKSYSEFRIYIPDFLSEDKMQVDNLLNKSAINKRTVTINDYVKEIINEAKLVFVNNYSFGALVDHQLKLLFGKMTEGSYIVSSNAFCPLKFRINSRNINDIEAMLHMSEFEPLNGHVSWTGRKINYYFQKIDRTLLEKYRDGISKKLKKNDHGNNKSLKMNFPVSISSSSLLKSSASSSSLLSSEYLSTSEVNENQINSQSPRKLNQKNKMKKCKATNNVNSVETASPVREFAKIKNFNSLRNKNLINSKTEKSTQQNIDQKSLKNHMTLNLSSLTSFPSENHENHLVKDCEISPGFYKQINNGRSLTTNKNDINSADIKKSTNDPSIEFDENYYRKELGDDIFNLIDLYCSKKNFLKN